ncbi:hypothetical protein I6F14_35015 [Bradyrhizobium sp. IC3069]|uniref:hypothetical protein n=1 Tax=unclassified Bradyrhizobium TaxID=2631580 RepID=UPI001CD4BA54|nr:MULTISPECIES: hypothetical protein [unclassified Bradyrhizobium]MCA1365451.1 hypothetical protein [Bradyrhizobium sp. IC4059]MCA1523150.1 hypothetical protein [Bradyrhizobium sp. IC3069]
MSFETGLKLVSGADLTKFDLQKYAANDAEAEARAERYKYVDPLQDEGIPPALLSSNHFIKYIKATALLYPFYEEEGRIKAASYEVRAKGSTIRWDSAGQKVVTKIEDGSTIYLPKNSITFVQIESKIRLPQYIAIRFNLRISHVHRGLLLGTGPLIDPEFDGEILIPIHNLTDEDYYVAQKEGLIWVEFTKTSAPPDATRPYRFERRKAGLSPTDYLDRANKNNPIRSSLEGVLVEARSRSIQAEKSARSARAWANTLAGFGIAGAAVATATLVLALHSYFGTMTQLADTVQDKASSALAKVEMLTNRTDDDRKSLDEAKKAIEEARKSSDESNKVLNDSSKQIQSLRDELAALKAAYTSKNTPTLRKTPKNAGQIRRGRGRLQQVRSSAITLNAN